MKLCKRLPLNQELLNEPNVKLIVFALHCDLRCGLDGSNNRFNNLLAVQRAVTHMSRFTIEDAGDIYISKLPPISRNEIYLQNIPLAKHTQLFHYLRSIAMIEIEHFVYSADSKSAIVTFTESLSKLLM